MIAVLGSANMDLTTRLPRIPRPGETVRGTDLRRSPGGKGANQAVAAARLAPDDTVAFFGKIGVDPFGDMVLTSLDKAGIDIRALERTPDQPTGTATIWVDDSAENAIAYVPGANSSVDLDFIDRVLPAIAAADILLLQLEVPIESIAYLLRNLDSDHPLVILDPAPAQDLSALPLRRVDLLTPNRGELTAVSGIDRLDQAMLRMRQLGVRHVVCKSGSQGAFVLPDHLDTPQIVAAPRIDAIDTTAAGDAFNAALACRFGLSAEPLQDAVRWATVAGALTTTRCGAQTSLPTRADVEVFLASEQPLTGDAKLL